MPLRQDEGVIIAGHITDHERRVKRLESLETAAGIHSTLVAQAGVTVDTVIVRVRLMPGVGKSYTILSWSLGADVTGAIQIDVWKDTHANYPPTDADSITNGFEMIILNDDHEEDLDLSNWTTVTINHGDWLFFYVDSVATITTISIALELAG